MKGIIQDGEAVTNKYLLQFAGGPEVVVTRVGELASELTRIEKPDKTGGTSGQVSMLEFEVDVPAHHDVDVAYLDRMYEAAQLGAPGYKIEVLLHLQRPDGTLVRTYRLPGVFVRGRKIPEHSMGPGDGSMTSLTYTLSADDCQPL